MLYFLCQILVPLVLGEQLLAVSVVPLGASARLAKHAMLLEDKEAMANAWVIL